MDPYIASICTGCVYYVPLVFGIPLGKLVDLFGNRITLMIIACSCELMSHILLATCSPTVDNAMVAIPWVSMGLLGVAYTISL